MLIAAWAQGDHRRKACKKLFLLFLSSPSNSSELDCVRFGVSSWTHSIRGIAPILFKEFFLFLSLQMESDTVVQVKSAKRNLSLSARICARHFEFQISED